MKLFRSILPLAVFGLVAAANAQITFSGVSASYILNPGSTTVNWITTPNGPGLTIDFTQNAPAFKVGAGTGFSTGTSTITYNVTSVGLLNGIDLVLQGDVQNFGRIQWTQSASTGAGSLGSIGGTILGGSYTGGANGAFTLVQHLSFSSAVNSFSVSQTMSSDINGQTLPSSSLALVGIVEHNFTTAVPEPASMSVLALGAVALIRRRRANKK